MPCRSGRGAEAAWTPRVILPLGRSGVEEGSFRYLRSSRAFNHTTARYNRHQRYRWSGNLHPVALFAAAPNRAQWLWLSPWRQRCCFHGYGLVINVSWLHSGRTCSSGDVPTYSLWGPEAWLLFHTHSLSAYLSVAVTTQETHTTSCCHFHIKGIRSKRTTAGKYCKKKCAAKYKLCKYKSATQQVNAYIDTIYYVLIPDTYIDIVTERYWL